VGPPHTAGSSGAQIHMQANIHTKKRLSVPQATRSFLTLPSPQQWSASASYYSHSITTICSSSMPPNFSLHTLAGRFARFIPSQLSRLQNFISLLKNSNGAWWLMPLILCTGGRGRWTNLSLSPAWSTEGVPGQPWNPVSKRHKNKNLSPTESKMHSNLIYCSCWWTYILTKMSCCS